MRPMPRPPRPRLRRRDAAALAAAGLLLGPGLVVVTAPARAQGGRVPTPPDMEGPFYPPQRPPEAGADLTRVPGQAARAEGEPLVVDGSVVDLAGRPLTGVLVELWQADARGSYLHPDGVGRQGRDPAFAGYGRLVTGADGRWRFVTVRPPAYGGRPPHLHLKFSAPGRPVLTTQLYVDSQRHGRLSLPTRRLADGTLAAEAEIVLGR